MTRENKVALVVGFALVLLIGVLISDHFSKARADRPADLAVHRTASTSLGSSMGDLVDLSHYFQPAETAPAAAPPPPDEGVRSRPPAEPALAGPIAEAPGPASPPSLPAEVVVPAASAHAPATPAAAPATAPEHEVRPGESLSVICQRYYRDQSLIDELAALNGIDDLDDVRAGMRLRVPPAATLKGGGAASAATANAGRAAQRTHTVQPGETLARIAARSLGSAGRWRELYEANRDLIDDPDEVEAGVVLKLPAARR